MENLISKELLKEVFPFDNLEGREWNYKVMDNILIITYNINKYFDGNTKQINIYELAHKCKEWAIKQSNRENRIIYVEITQIYTIFYKSRDKVSCCIHYFYEDKKSAAGKEFIANTEYESIFKACEWILKEVKK